MITKITEHTYGSHIYMKLQLDDGSTEEIDVFYKPDGSEVYRTTADSNDDLTAEEKQKRRNLIIATFDNLY